jgi:hypothetical protein
VEEHDVIAILIVLASCARSLARRNGRSAGKRCCQCPGGQFKIQQPSRWLSGRADLTTIRGFCTLGPSTNHGTPRLSIQSHVRSPTELLVSHQRGKLYHGSQRMFETLCVCSRSFSRASTHDSHSRTRLIPQHTRQLPQRIQASSPW